MISFCFGHLFSKVKHCFPKIPAIPAATPPIIPVISIKSDVLPSNGKSTAIFLARIK